MIILMNDTLPTIAFRRIRGYDGAQSGGFEQLSVELFARAHGLSRQLVRVNGAGGDGGVEAYAALENKGKVGMQAKFFDQLTDTQWRQIDKSVKTALDQHPDLKEYHVYVPLDRTKGRLGKTEGQVERWNALVETWHKLSNGADVEFIWQGRYEIELALKKAANHDLLFYWFGTPQFDDDWIDRILRAALRTLGERYQPARHVDARVGRELDRFVWSLQFEHEMERAYVKLAETCLDFTPTLQNIEMPSENKSHLAEVRKAIDAVVRIEYPVYGQRRVDQVLQPAQALKERLGELVSYHRTLQAKQGGKLDNKIKDAEHKIDTFAREVRDWVDRLKQCREVDHHCSLVGGDAGTGKSHLLANCAVKAWDHKQPVLLVLGEQFLDSRPPLAQLCEQIGWNGGPDSLLSALNVAGSLAARPALLFIDALNESGERRLWKSHLHSVAEEVRKYPHVRLVVSCRSDFVGITMPNDFKSGVPNGWGIITHRGLGDVLAEVVAHYFKSYNIQSSHFPPLLDEFRNPLFLDTFCRAFENQSLPGGPITLQTVMDRRIARVSGKIQQDIDCDEYHVRQAIQSLAEKMRENQGLPVEENVARAAIEPHSPATEKSRSLYTHLLSSGIIVRRIDRYWEDNPPVVVRFAFERFSDFFIARGLIKDVADAAAFRQLVSEEGPLGWMRGWQKYSDNRGVARALAVLVPEQFGIELVDFLPDDIEHREDVLADLMDSLPWRSEASVTGSTQKLVLEASRYMSTTSFIEALLRVSTIPDHPFNAHFLHDRLTAMALPRRDSIWTIPIAQLAAEADTVPSTLVEWAIQVPRDLVSDDQAELVATVLLWFGSSNRVTFRSRAGLAAIRILFGRPHVTSQLVERFDALNDPYVVERLYAVACGVAMREPPGEGLRVLAATVQRLVFATGDVRPHVLLRDYAQTLIEVAAHRGCADSAIRRESFRPPFASKMPSVIDEAEAEQIINDKKWGRIAWSVRTESMGIYGDFGRYVMGYAVHRFLQTEIDQPIPEMPYCSHEFDDRLARRWVLQRVKDLGWTGEAFEVYDDRRHDSRITDDELKVERIGKKYQWIALHELLGYLSDHYHMKPDWDDKPRIYKGAWQINQRDFDPSAVPGPRKTFAEEEEGQSRAPSNSSSSQWKYVQSYPDPFSDLALLADRSTWVKTRPDDPIRLLTVMQGADPRRWVALDGYWSWKEPRILRLRHGWEGRCEMWIHARSWLVNKGDLEGFLERIRKLNFWGHGIQGISPGDGWLGEYPYGPAFNEARRWCEEPDSFTAEDEARHITTSCDWDRRGGVIVPSPQLCDALELRWSGVGATFLDRAGATITTDAHLPRAGETPPCVIDAERLMTGLTCAGLEIVWGIVGERHCWNGERMLGDVETQFSGVYALTSDGVVGDLTIVKVVQRPSQ